MTKKLPNMMSHTENPMRICYRANAMNYELNHMLTPIPNKNCDIEIKPWIMKVSGWNQYHWRKKQFLTKQKSLQAWSEYFPNMPTSIRIHTFSVIPGVICIPLIALINDSVG